LFTAIFIWTAGVAELFTGAKKLPPLAFAKKGSFAARLVVVEVVVEDFSALAFIIYSAMAM
jgi:hypothetical protein